MPRSKQRGTAIIIALFVVGLVAFIAVSMMARLGRDIHRTSLLVNSTQASLYAEGSLAWAADSLRAAWLNQKPHQLIDHLPQTLPRAKIGTYTLTTTLSDAQALFNINSVKISEWQVCFKHLLTIVEPHLNSEAAEKITKSVASWVSTLKNTEDENYYSKLPQPYRAPHRPMASVSELRLVRGVSAELYQKLKPYLIALPADEKINVNTASLPVLQSLSPTMTAEGARSIDNARRQQPFIVAADFLKLDVARNHGLTEAKIIVTSAYFLIHTLVQGPSQKLTLTSLVMRSAEPGKKAIVTVLWQSKGGI